MPELPEVETIRRGLEAGLTGVRIDEVAVKQCRVFQTHPARLAGQLRGQTIHKLRRRGKFLVFELDRDYLVVHLGMTGQLTLRDPALADARRFHRHPATGLQRARQHAPDQHTHMQLGLDGGSKLLYRDVRKFGKIYLLGREAVAWERFFHHLGLEPLSDEYTLTAFLESFRRRKLRIKSLLLDQRFVAGVGNIYADEALFEARVHPARKVTTLRRYEKEALFRSIPAVLERGIHFGGTSLRDYINSDGGQGSNQEELQVYGRAGEPCRRCSTLIVRTVISQRGTHFCPACQPRNPLAQTRIDRLNP